MNATGSTSMALNIIVRIHDRTYLNFLLWLGIDKFFQTISKFGGAGVTDHVETFKFFSQRVVYWL